jgi:RNA recognition motif-containing protein
MWSEKMTTLYVGRFDSVVTQEHLREALRVHGAIASVSLIQNFAFVTFEDPSSAEKAYRAHRARGLQLCGRRVQVNWAKQQEGHQRGADLRKVLDLTRRLGGGSRPPSLHNVPRSFCTVCERPGHLTENCWYRDGGGPQSRVPFVQPVRGGQETRRPGLGGEGQRANAAPSQAAELSKRGREKSAPKGNVIGRGSLDKGGAVKANLPEKDAGGVEKLEKTPPRSRSADPASERVSSHKQKGGSRESGRRGRSISRESGGRRYRR